MGKSILLIGNHPPPFGGVPTHILYLAPYLAMQGWNVHILSLAGSKRRGIHRIEYHQGGYLVHRPTRLSPWVKLLSPSHQVVSAWRFKSFMLESFKVFLAFLGVAKMVKEIVTQYGIKVISAYHVMAGLFGGWVSEEQSVPLVTTVFGEIYARPDFYRRRLAEVKYVCDTSEKLLSCSRHCAESFRLLGLSPKVETVYYGIDTTKFSPENDGSMMRASLGISDEDKVVIFVGRMVREMGLHILLQSIPQVLEVNSKIKFVIIGTSGELLEDTVNLSQKLSRNVFVVPDAPFDDLPLYYAASTVAVVPSINDRACFSLTSAEAMAAGKPVIASKIGGTPEAVVDGETGMLIPPENPSALAEAILGLTDDDKAIIEMGRCGRERAETFLDKDQTNRKMEQIFNEVVA